MTLKGKAVIATMAGITYSAGVTVAGTEAALHQGLDFERSSDISYVKNSSGDDVTAIYTNKKKTITITVIPGGDAIADARSLCDKFMLAASAGITVVDTETTTVDGAFNVNRTRLTRTVDGAAAVVLEAENRDDVTITSTVA